MQNAGLTIGMVAIGLGLASIGFNLNGNQANATTAVGWLRLRGCGACTLR